MYRSSLFPSKLTLILILFLACRSISLQAQNRNGNEFMSSLLKAEKDFQHRVITEGQQRGYLDVMRLNTTLFKPGPVNGPDYMRGPNTFKGSMLWSPSWAEISKDGYFGYTTGPYTYLVNDTTIYGEYVSIWLRAAYQPTWKLLLEGGVSHGKPAGPRPAVSYPAISVADNPPIYPRVIAISKDILFSTDELFATFLNTRSTESAYKEYLDKNSRLFVQGKPPVTGKDSILSYFKNRLGVLRTRTNASYVSYSRDMGFTYGTGEFIDAYRKKPGDYKFNYLRIWRKTSDGIWRIILEMHMSA